MPYSTCPFVKPNRTNKKIPSMLLTLEQSQKQRSESRRRGWGKSMVHNLYCMRVNSNTIATESQ